MTSVLVMPAAKGVTWCKKWCLFFPMIPGGHYGKKTLKNDAGSLLKMKSLQVRAFHFQKCPWDPMSCKRTSNYTKNFFGGFHILRSNFQADPI